MTDLEELSERLGCGVCLVLNTSLTYFNMDECDVDEINKIVEILRQLDDFEAGLFEFENKRYFIAKIEGGYMAINTNDDNIGFLYKKIKDSIRGLL
jgi:hypothetical protein